MYAYTALHRPKPIAGRAPTGPALSSACSRGHTAAARADQPGQALQRTTLGLAILDPTYRSRSIGLALVGMVGSVIAQIVAQKFHLNPLQACVRKVLGDELKVRQPPGELHRLTGTRQSHLQRDYVAPTTELTSTSPSCKVQLLATTNLPATIAPASRQEASDLARKFRAIACPNLAGTACESHDPIQITSSYAAEALGTLQLLLLSHKAL